MDIYVEEKRLSLHHKMKACTVDGEQIYQITGKPVSIGAKMYVEDMQGNELLYIHQKVFAMHKKYTVEQNGEEIAELERKIGLHKNFVINGLDWTIEGDLTGHNYKILGKDGAEVCSVERTWLQWGDTYHVAIANEDNAAICVGIVVALDVDEDSEQADEVGDIGQMLSR